MKFFFIFIFLLLIQLINILTLTCDDENCIFCPSESSCKICNRGYEVYHNKCERKCNSINHCSLCNPEVPLCIKCNKNCSLNNEGRCNCKVKYILIGVSILLGLILIGFVVYLLTHTSMARKFYHPPSIFHSNNNPSQNNSDPIVGRDNSLTHLGTGEKGKLKEIEILKDFNKNKINWNGINYDFDGNIENKKCECCQINFCNLKLDCGCFVCFDCENKLIKNKICTHCDKKFNNSQQITCSICFMNKKEISTFNCQCKMIVCKECYVKWRLSNKTCPVCRSDIL